VWCIRVYARTHVYICMYDMIFIFHYAPSEEKYATCFNKQYFLSKSIFNSIFLGKSIPILYVCRRILIIYLYSIFYSIILIIYLYSIYITIHTFDTEFSLNIKLMIQ